MREVKEFLVSSWYDLHLLGSTRWRTEYHIQRISRQVPAALLVDVENGIMILSDTYSMGVTSGWFVNQGNISTRYSVEDVTAV